MITNAVLVSHLLISALVNVESHGYDKAIGDDGRAWGCLQITQQCVDDVNRIAGTHYSHSNALVRADAEAMATVYLKYYGDVYTRKTGKVATNEILARMWNGGPNAWKSPKTTDAYWAKVKKVINILSNPVDRFNKPMIQYGTLKPIIHIWR